ncbi:MAG: tetratricopeptide repeat protein [Phyllobacteriaceae bacterium]|nr:tetratricopeptide repeat protein [Phyllobacteriaceae bacterium]
MFMAMSMPAFAQQQGQLFAAEQDGYGRLILSFPALDQLPSYRFRLENGVLSLEFDEEVSIVLPDVGLTMPNYLSVARVDPDGRGLRIGLRSGFNFNRVEAGEQLFIDLMPTTWQGMPPPLPQEVIDELAERARMAAIKAERDRKARMAAELDPKVDIRVGRNATFLRLQFDWSVPTDASFSKKGNIGAATFEWPIDIDLTPLISSLPEELVSVQTGSSADGAAATFIFAEGVEPRFYELSPSQYVLDIDITGQSLPELAAEDLLTAEEESDVAAADAEVAPQIGALQATPPESITPFVNVLGSTVRLVFPFEQDTPAAVFRRGDSVWMIFDTVSGVNNPPPSSDLDAIASEFAVISSGDTQVVRIDLSQERLATLGSEGMAWVLSLGDMMLSPTEPVELTRRRDVEGSFEMVADVIRPGRIHDFRDPLVGDMLKVVTSYPPARGLTRTLDYVDFTALRSVHGLVLKPKSPSLRVALDSPLAVISSSGGLTVSARDALRNAGSLASDASRSSFLDLGTLAQSDPQVFLEQRDRLELAASALEGRERDVARLDLAQYYVANHFGLEALGVLRVLEDGLTSDDLVRRMRMNQAVANIVAGRPNESLEVLNAASLDQDVDALFWRAIARAATHDYKGARLDAMEARPVVDSYPVWARNEFRLAAARAAVEEGDANLAERMLEQIDFPSLSVEEASLHHLLSGRVDEIGGRLQEALDTYGQVITSEVRPTRAEAVYRTLLVLDREGRLDLAKATQTLSSGTMLWRGDALEADMLELLAQLYFRNGDYRLGFETVKTAVANYPESPQVNTLRDQAQAMFGDLFLNGVADSMSPVAALGIYYDFRHLTPPGARGDEMIRNLARRLVRVDLLPQAAELLQYQLDNRLRGVARTQVAADLAVIYLADRKPHEAMRVLQDTQMPDLPESLARQRRILEARAMIDGGRDQLALDLISKMDGKDVALLRIDAHWKARRYSQAGEMIEALYGRDLDGRPLDRATRLNLIKAGVGYVLAGDDFSMARLRSKFGEAMVNSPEWAMFDFVTGPIQATSLEFKQVAAEVAALDSLEAFLASYRETYAGEGALAPVNASEPKLDIASR